MADYGHKYADMKISEVDRKLKRTYRTAQTELKKKLSDFNKRYEARNKEKKKQLNEGKISKQDYQNWLTGQVFIRNQWQNKINQINAVMLDHNRQAIRIVNESKFDVFAENYNFQAFRAEKEMAVSFNLYNAEAVARLLLDDPKLLPEWKIDKEKDYVWNQEKTNNIVMQGIIQGEGVPEITKRLCEDLCSKNEDRMRTFARTAITGAENAGRQQQMNDAAKLGIEVHKQWEATHDSRTRDAHRFLDGQEVPYDEPFESPLGKIKYPGDMDAKPANVYNCRCTMVTVYPKYEDRQASAKRYENMNIDGQSYGEWKKFNSYAEWKEQKNTQQKQTQKETETIESLDEKINALFMRMAEWDDTKYGSSEESANEYAKIEEEMNALTEKKTELQKAEGIYYNIPIGEDLSFFTNDGTEKTVKTSFVHDFFMPNGKSGKEGKTKGEMILFELDDGMKMYFKRDMDTKKQDLSPDVLLQAYYDIPAWYRAKMQKEIRVVDYENPQDGYWRKAYGETFTKSYMNGGKEIDIWEKTGHDYDYLKEALTHEGGHKIDNDSEIESLSPEWWDAMEKDKNISGKSSPTKYGETNAAEDYAESCMNFIWKREQMERDFPNRTKILEKRFGLR